MVWDLAGAPPGMSGNVRHGVGGQERGRSARPAGDRHAGRSPATRPGKRSSFSGEAAEPSGSALTTGNQRPDGA